MSILIKGMEMPIFEHQSWDIRKGTDKKWYIVDTNAETSDGKWHEIVPVPPHGKLIDADALIEDLNFDIDNDLSALDLMDFVGVERKHIQFDKDCKQNCIWYLSEAPTVLEAEVK